jgi:hypothetical protein
MGNNNAGPTGPPIHGAIWSGQSLVTGQTLVGKTARELIMVDTEIPIGMSFKYKNTETWEYMQRESTMSRFLTRMTKADGCKSAL